MKKTYLIIFCFLIANIGIAIAQTKETATTNLKQVLIPFEDDSTYLFGYKDSISNKVTIAPKYLKVLPFSEGMAAVYVGGTRKFDEYDDEEYISGGKWGYINTLGTLVIPAKYDFASVFDNHSAIVSIDIRKDSSIITKYRVINTKGIVTVPIQYDELGFACNNLFYASNFNKEGILIEGVIDNAGLIKIPVKYQSVLLYDGLAVVKENDKEGLVNLNNQIVIPIENKNVFYHKEDNFFWVIVTDNSSYYYHKSGVKFDTKTDFKNGVAIVSKDKKYGLIDKNVKLLSPLKYDYLDIYYSGKYIKTTLNHKYGYINTMGAEIIPCRYDYLSSFDNGLALAEIEKKSNFIDTLDHNVFPNMYDNVYTFKNQPHLNKVEINQRIGLINLKERKEITPPKYDWIGDFHENMARVLIESTLDTVSKKFIGGKFGFININGEEVVPPIYSEASNFKDGIATVKLNGVEMRIGMDGKKYIEKYDNINYAIEAFDMDAIKDFILKGTDLNKEYWFKSKNGNYNGEFYPIVQFLDKVSLLTIQNNYRKKEQPTLEIIKLFVEHGFDVNTVIFVGSNMRSLLVEVIITGRKYFPDETLNIIKYLVENKADVNFGLNDNFSENPLYTLCYGPFDHDYEFFKYLIDHGAQASCKGEKGNVLIKQAKQNGLSKEIITLLKESAK
jgi:hypothetical protein